MMFSAKKMRKDRFVRLRSCLLLIVVGCLTQNVTGQEYHGTTGLLHAPSAETDSAGTFRGGFAYFDRAFLPPLMPDHDSFGYSIGITAFPWVEISYCATMLWMHMNNKKDQPMGFYNEDRRVNVKLRPLKEGKWWPAVAVGMDDIGRFKLIKSGTNYNNKFQNIYGVLSKNFDIRGHRLGAHIAYRYFPAKANSNRRGVAGGITYTPRLGKSLQGPRAWLQRPRVIVEWDGVGVNVGADVLLWRHLFVQAALIHGTGFTGGLSYHYTMKF